MSVPDPIVKVRPRVTSTELQFWWSPPAQPLVAVGYNSDASVCIITSPDGITWTYSSNNPFSGGAATGVAWNGSYLVAVGYNSDNTVCIAISTDGLHWNASINNPFSGGTGKGIAWNGSYWVAVAVGLNCMATSTDGLNWTVSTNNPFYDGRGVGQCNGVAWNGSYWIAVGSNLDSSIAIVKSTDGLYWTASNNNPFSVGVGYGIAWNGSYWVAAGGVLFGGCSIATSTDGLTWTPSTNNPFTSSVAKGVAWNGSYWVAVGYNSDHTVCIATSTDALYWNYSMNNPFNTGGGYGVVWNDYYWVATGYKSSGVSGIIATSPDGLYWTSSTNNSFATGAGYGITATVKTPTGYILECTNPALSYTLAANVTNKIVSGLTPLTDYSFTIKTDISGSYSAVVPFRTVRTSNRPQPVATLTKSESIVNSLLTLTVNWTDPADYAYYYVYGLRYATGTKESIYKGTSDYGTLTHTFKGLDPTRSYAFHIQRGNDGGYSVPTTLTTTAMPFDPRTVGGLQFWADATDVSGNGSSVPDGSTVGVWKDKSGHANDASGVDFLATVQTDSVGRYLDLSGGLYKLVDGSWLNSYFTFFVVDRPTSYASGNDLIGNDSNLIIWYNANSIEIGIGTASVLGSDFSTLNAPVNIWCFTNYGGLVAYYNKMVSGQDSTSHAFPSGTQLSIGNQGDGYNGRMREILMYSGTMTEDDREAIQTYLYSKWMPQPATFSSGPVQNSAILWLDAQDRETMFNYTAGTIPIMNGDAILLWKDKSGFENDINDISGGTTLLYNTVGNINSLPGVLVSPLNGPVQTSNYIQTGDASVFIVAQLNSGVENIFTHDAGGNFALSSDASGNLSWHESTTKNNNRYITNNTPFIFHGTMKKGQLLTGTFMDASGVQKSYTIDTLLISVSFSPIQLSGENDMTYGEVIYYNRVLTAEEIQTNVTYLSNKWRIHPQTSPVAPRLPGLKLWLDSSDPYTVFDNSGALTIWKDRSGNNYHAMPHGGPTVADGIFFDGSGQWLSLPDGALPLDNYSYYIVSDFVSDSAIVSGGSTDVSGQLWVAVGYNTGSTTTIATSTDGMTWTNSSNNTFTGGQGFGISWNGSYWVAVGLNSGNTVAIAKSTDGMTWTNSTDNPFTGGYGKGITWNGSYWVAVGTNTDNTVCIAKSPDGMTWTLATDNPFSSGVAYGVAWNDSYWVAVGNNYGSTICIAISTDGMTWSASTNNPFLFGGGYGIAWNGSYWVAVGWAANNTQCIAKSTDGDTWATSANNPFGGGTGNGVAWNGSYWVAVGSNGGNTVCIAKSTDGDTWTNSTNNPFTSGIAYGISWNGSYWVAVGFGQGDTVSIAKSTDGMTWTNPSNNPFTGGVAYGIASGIAPIHNEIMSIKAVTEPQYLYVAGGKAFPPIMYSNNGLNWYQSDDNNIIGGDCTALLYAGGLWTAGGSRIGYSQDGIVWHTTMESITSEFVGCNGFGYGGGIWVAGVTGTYKIVYSTDGMIWNASTNGPDIFVGAGRCSAVAYGNGMWVAGGYSQGMLGNYTVAYSTDGMTWTVSTYGSSILTGECVSVAYGNGVFVASGVGSNTIIYSVDGIDWAASTNGSSILDPCYTVAYGNGVWVAGGTGAYRLAYSTDGITWTASSSGTSIFTNACNALSYDGKWIASGNSGIVAYSSDGIHWGPSVTVPIGGTVQAIGLRSLGTAQFAQTSFNNDYDSSGSIIPNRSILTDSNPITGTRVIESIYNGTGKSLYLSGLIGFSDNSSHLQDASNNFIGRDLSGSYMHGSIKEMLVYNEAHTDSQRKQVETYLKKKWSSGGYMPNDTCLWLDGASAINFELSGNRIQVWKDKSGLINMPQNVVWAQPRYSLDSVTGRYGVQFGSEGITTGFTSPSSPFGSTNSWSIFMVQRYDFSSDQSSDGIDGVFVSHAYEIVNPTFTVGTHVTATPSIDELSMYNEIGLNTMTVEIHKRPVITSQLVNNLSCMSYSNGIMSSAGAETLTEGMSASLINMGFTGTLTPALAGSMRGYIYEFIAYNRPVDTVEQQAVEGYLAWKWGLQDSLAPTHPYYVGPP